MIYLPPLDHAPANTTPQRHIKNRISPSARPIQPLPECGDVRIVIKHGRNARHIGNPPFQIKVRPSTHLVRSRHSAELPIHRTTKTNTDSIYLKFR